MDRTVQTPVPPIGQPWEGQGGIYAGVIRGHKGQPDHHLILATDEPKRRLTWRKALVWASKVNPDGYSDFGLPTRREAAVLFGNLGDQFGECWYWTNEGHSDRGAWLQNFYYGNQLCEAKSDEACARAVRRLPVGPSVLRIQED